MVICSCRALAVTYYICQCENIKGCRDQLTAITGTGLVSLPCFCHSLMRLMQVNPSITEESVSVFKVNAGRQNLVTWHFEIHKNDRQWCCVWPTILCKGRLFQKHQSICTMVCNMYLALGFLELLGHHLYRN